MNVPANSAVDGYASPTLICCRPRHSAAGDRARGRGHPLGRAVEPGEAIRTFTGAPMPEAPTP